jgi:hypothetical protein
MSSSIDAPTEFIDFIELIGSSIAMHPRWAGFYLVASVLKTLTDKPAPTDAYVDFMFSM